MDTPQRAILHVDMDAFFTSVEQRDNPELRGKPVLVGGTGPRSVVAAASYESRAFGCRSAMPMSQALRLCPQAIVVSHGMSNYSAVSKQIFEILREFTPLVQPVSIDEGYLDVTDSIPLLGDARTIAINIRKRIREETQLTASVGVAPNKFLAKLASDMDKPDGLTVIEHDRVHEIIDPLPVGRIHGVGPSSEKQLHKLGVRTIGELRKLPESLVADRLGSHGLHAWNLAHGRDERPVHLGRERKSLGHERTFGEDIVDKPECAAVVARHAEQVASELRAKGLFARTITLKLRYGDFITITRAVTLDAPSDSTREIVDAALGLFESWVEKEGFRPLRLIGVTGGALKDHAVRQLSLFGSTDSDAREQRVARTTDAILERFGKGSITSARAAAAPKKTRQPDSEPESD